MDMNGAQETKRQDGAATTTATATTTTAATTTTTATNAAGAAAVPSVSSMRLKTPHPCVDHFFSVTCGNTHLYWALHNSMEHHGRPQCVWRTRPVKQSDLAVGEPLTALERYIPEAVKSVIYGGADNKGGKEAATTTSKEASTTSSPKDRRRSTALTRTSTATEKARMFRRSLRIPTLVVYFLSSNKQHEDNVRKLFSDLQLCEFIQIRPEHMFDPDKQQLPYKGMGADRVAAVKGAGVTHGYPCLVLDGGTALTYTAAGADHTLWGGGIGLGINAKFQALAKSTEALPEISPATIKQVLEQCKTEAQPLDLFAKSTQEAMIGTVLRETQLLVRNIVINFLKQCKKIKQTNQSGALLSSAAPAEEVTAPESKKEKKQDEETPTNAVTGGTNQGDASKKTVKEDATDGKQQKPKVVITGGDWETLHLLLQSDSAIFAAEDFSHVDDAGSNRDDDFLKDVEIIAEKQLIQYGIQQTLVEHQNGVGTLSRVEEIRQEAMGQRVARFFPVESPSNSRTKKKEPYRGTVVDVSCNAEGQLDDDFFKVVYDDGDEEELYVEELYDGLILFKAHSEIAIPASLEAAIAKKVEDAEAFAQTLKTNSESVRKHLDGVLDRSMVPEKQDDHDDEKESNKKKTSTKSPPRSTRKRRETQSTRSSSRGKKAKRSEAAPAAAAAAAAAATDDEAAPIEKDSQMDVDDEMEAIAKNDEGGGGVQVPEKERAARVTPSFPSTATNSTTAAVAAEKEAEDQAANQPRDTTTSTTAPSAGGSDEFMGKRIAKIFDGQVFFGTITKFSPAEQPDEVDFWNVFFDDGDSEDLERQEVLACLKVYAKNKDDDEFSGKKRK